MILDIGEVNVERAILRTNIVATKLGLKKVFDKLTWEPIQYEILSKENNHLYLIGD